MAFALGPSGGFKRNPLVGVGAGIFGRFVCHFAFGVIFFSMFAPAGMSLLLHSVLYNGSHLIGEFVLTVVVMLLLVKRRTLELYL